MVQNSFKFWTENILIPPDQDMSQRAKCFYTPIFYTTHIYFQCPCYLVEQRFVRIFWENNKLCPTKIFPGNKFF